jgi:hypothetical protein
VPVDPSAPRERLAFLLHDITAGNRATLPSSAHAINLLDRVPGEAAARGLLDPDLETVASHPPARLSGFHTSAISLTSSHVRLHGQAEGVMIEQSQSRQLHLGGAKRNRTCRGETPERSQLFSIARVPYLTVTVDLHGR